MLGIRSSLLGFVDDNPFKLFFLIEEIRNVQKGISFQAYVNEGRLHSRKNTHYATLIDVADDPLVLFSTLDVELGHLVVLDDCYFLFFSVDADY